MEVGKTADVPVGAAAVSAVGSALGTVVVVASELQAAPAIKLITETFTVFAEIELKIAEIVFMGWRKSRGRRASQTDFRKIRGLKSAFGMASTWRSAWPQLGVRHGLNLAFGMASTAHVTNCN